MENTQTRDIFSDQIDLPEKQMRKHYSRDDLYDLAENIKQNGLINPITVRPKGDRFELVAGQRRLLAMRIAGIIRIQCVVREVNEAAALNIMAAENLERSDVDIVDEANFVAELIKQDGADELQVAKRLNRGVQYVKDRLAVAAMPDYMQDFLRSGELKLGAALLLMQIEPDEKRRLWAGQAAISNETIHNIRFWVEQHRVGILPGAVTGPDDVPQAPAGEYKPDMFVCAVDGKEYLASECRAVFVYKANLPLLEAFRAELNKKGEEFSVRGSENPGGMGEGVG